MASQGLARVFNLLSAMATPVIGGPSRSAAAWQYVVLRFKSAMIKSRPERVKLFGRWVKPDSYSLLVLLFSEIFITREYEFVSSRPDPVILDCGGNIGLATLYFTMLYPKARVKVFEPSPGAFECLQRMKEWNGLAGVELHNVAAAAEPGEIDFYFDAEHPASVVASTLADRGGGTHVRVKAVRLSDYVDGEVELLKLDIEGAEMPVLEELAASGKMRQIRQLAIEYHHHLKPGDDDLARCLRLLETQGFTYQIRSVPERLCGADAFRDIMIYAYRRGA